MLSRFTPATFGSVALTATLTAQTPARTLTIDAIYDPQVRVDFSGAPATNMTWLDNESYMLRRGNEWLRVNAATGRTTPLLDGSPARNAPS